MTPKTQNDIALFCYSVVSHMFASMNNSRMRGPKFTWDEFPEMMEEHCRVMVFTSVLYPKKQQQECEDHAAQTGREIAENLVKWMTQ